MFIVWGRGGGRSVMGELAEDKCEACGEKVARTAFVDFTYWHIWYLFSFLTGRRYQTACNACGAVAPYDKTEAKLRFQRDNIPFLRKNGWAVCVSLLALLFIFGAVSSDSNRRRLEAMLDAPLAGDIYLADLSKIDNSGYASNTSAMHGAMALVDKLEDGRFIVATSDVAYNKKSGFAGKMRKGEVSFTYDEDDPLLLSREDFAKLYGERVIYDGKR